MKPATLKATTAHIEIFVDAVLNYADALCVKYINLGRPINNLGEQLTSQISICLELYDYLNPKIAKRYSTATNRLKLPAHYTVVLYNALYHYSNQKSNPDFRATNLAEIKKNELHQILTNQTTNIQPILNYQP